MALKNIDLRVVLTACSFTLAEGTTKRSKHNKNPAITFSPEVAVTLIIGFLTTLFFVYWFIFRPKFQARRRSRHNRINMFLIDFWKNDVLMKPSWGSKEYKDISSSIQSLIEGIIVKVFSCSCKDSTLVIKRENVSKYVKLIGSCQEESKVQRPDEFDFSITFPAFSEDNVFVEHGSSIKPDKFMCIHKYLLYEYDNAFVQLRYTGNIDKESQMSSLLTKVNNHYYISAFKMHSFFKRRIRSVVKRMVLDKYSKTCSTGKLVVEFPDEDIYNSEENGPAWTLPLFWDRNYGKGYRINVDIAPVILISDQFPAISMTTFKDINLNAKRFMSYPAICYMLGNDRYDYMSNIEQMKGGTYSLTYEDVIARMSDENKLFVELSFLTSHVHHENTLMKELKNSFNNLFITYQIFKRLEPLWSRFKVKGQLHGLRFHSYVLKTIILDEIIHGNETISRHDDVATCFKVILNRIIDLSDSCLRGNHESVTSLWFDEHILTCAQLPQVLMYDEEYLHAFRQQFRVLWNLLNTVSEDDAYEYYKYEHVILDLISKPANFRIN